MKSGSGSWADARARIEALLGRRAWSNSEVEVREADIIRYHEAIGLPPPSRLADDSMIAPPMFVPPLAVGGRIGIDGRRSRPDELVIDHPALRRRLMGGCSVTFQSPIRAGERISSETLFESVVEKLGSDGPMLLVTTATTYRDQHGAVKRVERWTIVHR